MARKPPHNVHAANRPADTSGVKESPLALDSDGRPKRRSRRVRGASKLALTDGSALALGRRFEAAAFDWDGTAVTDRKADASELRELFGALVEAGFDLAVITGTHVGNVDGQLQLRPNGPGRIIVGCNRGSEVYELTSVGPVPLERRVASAEEDEMLDRAAALARERLGAKGLTVSVISDRLNRRKIDLIPLPEWADPPKAELPKLLAATEARLAAAQIKGLPEAVELVRDCGLEAGLPDPRVTSDAKYAEVGLTDKTDSARYVISWLARRGIRPEQILIGGDEFGPLGNTPGSDSLILVPETAGDVCISVGPEPEGTPQGVLDLGGGPELFADILSDQLRRRHEGELPLPVEEAGWQVVIDDSRAGERVEEKRAQ